MGREASSNVLCSSTPRIMALCALALLSGQGFAQTSLDPTDTGPLRGRDQILLGAGFLTFDPVAADVLEKGQWRIDLSLSMNNDFAKSEALEFFLDERPKRGPLSVEQLRAVDAKAHGRGVFLVDDEHYRTEIAAQRGIGNRMQVEIVVPVISLQGGVLDSAIEGFHDLFSFDQSGRLGAHQNDLQVFIGGEDGEVLVTDQSGTGLGDIELGAKVELVPGRRARSLRWAAEAVVKLPTGDIDRFASSGSADYGAQLVATKDFRESHLHGSLGVVRLGRMERLGISSQMLFSVRFAFERSLGPRTSVVAQVATSQSPLRDLELRELSAESTLLTIGVKRAVGAQILFAGVTENIVYFDNSPDIGVHFGLIRLF